MLDCLDFTKGCSSYAVVGENIYNLDKDDISISEAQLGKLDEGLPVAELIDELRNSSEAERKEYWVNA